LWTICSSGANNDPPISASWWTRIIGMSWWHPASLLLIVRLSQSRFFHQTGQAIHISTHTVAYMGFCIYLNIFKTKHS
jgi:hypothetical protein